ncbi:MAG: MBL fold metallo-hydrolase [Prosthecobacter sp.]|uniref:MBL fold metallo-hydrolase n=1 Tax=Prosthecobacter sp. TaxID=1965333 RepID=UPI0025F58A13|nr:MBL fold metallo-hydrolase [Prosthecobacter sp.]MCF7785536.1 MBL fold metallo-hydrolase [Prosthecobacter sp.]
MATKATKPKANKPANDFRVRIRMYQHGLGDCFLLSFPKGKTQCVHVMIDCGVVLGTSEPGAVMTKVAEDIRKTTGGKVDVLVITHEHWDHLSGFDSAQARAVFEKIEFGTLWLAWTEDENNPLANRLRAEREKKKAAAKAAKEASEKRGLKTQAARMAGVLGFFGAKAAGAGDEEDAGGTAGALNFLKAKCPPTILETGGKPFSIPGVNGVRVYVLGPPLDSDAMKKTNPSKDEGYAMGGEAIGLTDAFLAAFDPNDELAQPFAPSLRMPVKELKTRQAVKINGIISGIDGYANTENQWRNIDDAWLAMGERLALQLDNATNNTSLVLAFELEDSNDVLLFVGDAQAGNWRSWDDCEWTVKDKDGESREVTAADLLLRTVFYKVGHHGSHNATLREKGLERMNSRRLAAVIPVDTRVAHEVKGWDHMPLPAIRERLEQKCAVVFQSDMAPSVMKNAPEMRWKESVEKFDVRMKSKTTKKVETVRKQSLYTDYFL